MPFAESLLIAFVCLTSVFLTSILNFSTSLTSSLLASSNEIVFG